MFALVGELIRNFNLQKQRSPVELLCGTRLFMFPRLLQIGAIAGTIEGYFALLAAALGADASVNGGTEALLFANFADGTTQIGVLLFSIMALDAVSLGMAASTGTVV